jgi:hypothetical protein
MSGKQAKCGCLRQLPRKAIPMQSLVRVCDMARSVPRQRRVLPLADAQLVVAREYGFASWPRLVQYFRDVERQAFARRSQQSVDQEFYESSARSLIARH